MGLLKKGKEESGIQVGSRAIYRTAVSKQRSAVTVPVSLSAAPPSARGDFPPAEGRCREAKEG